MIPDRIRSGRGSPLDSFELPMQQTVFFRRAVSLAAVVVVRSATTAAILCHHDGRTDVTEEDVQKSLKYHAMNLLSSENLEEDVDSAEKDIFGDLTEESESPEEVDSPQLPAREGESRDCCECDICVKIDDAVAAWDAWNPTDPGEVYVKQSVQRSIDQCSVAVGGESSPEEL